MGNIAHPLKPSANALARKLVADLTLDKEMLSEVIKKGYDGWPRPRDD